MTDLKADLEEFDSDWAETHRAKVILEERDNRKSSRGRVKTGGYLDIWSDPDTNDRNQTHGDLPDPNEEVNKM